MPMSLHDSLVLRFQDIGRHECRRTPCHSRWAILADARRQTFEFGLNVMPVLGGESLVMRILDRSDVSDRLDNLARRPKTYRRLTASLRQPNGTILDRRGRLAAAKRPSPTRLQAVNCHRKRRLRLKPVRNCSCRTWRDADAGQQACRHDNQHRPSRSRHHILSGEMRAETAAVLVEAALSTGHLAAYRFTPIDTGAKPFSSSGDGHRAFISRRNADGGRGDAPCRRLCDHCKEPAILQSAEREAVQLLATQGGYEITSDTEFSARQAAPSLSSARLISRPPDHLK